jgi:hypothetical protein
MGHRFMFGNLKEHQKARFTRGGEKESSGGRTTKGCVDRGTNFSYTNPEQKEVLGSGGDRGFQPLSLITISWEMHRNFLNHIFNTNAEQLFKSQIKCYTIRKILHKLVGSHKQALTMENAVTFESCS